MTRFYLGDLVSVKQLKLPNDPESEFYLTEFKGKLGEIVSRTESSEGDCYYQVQFKDNSTGIFYENEIERVTE